MKTKSSSDKYPNFFTREEANSIIHKTREIGNRRKLHQGDRNETFYKLLYRTGIRVSEAVTLDASSVNFKGELASITVKRKGGAWDTISLDKRMSEDLERYIDDHKIKRGHVFNMTRQRAWQILRKAIDELGLDEDRPEGRRRSPHTFRYSNGVELLMAGMSTREVQKRLGHSRITTTEGYLRFLPDERLAEKNADIWDKLDEDGL